MKSLLVCMILSLSALTAVAGPFDRGGGGWGRGDDRGRDDRGRDDRGRGPGGGREEWRQVDEVHFNDGSTTNAIRNCKAAREQDVRCVRSRDYQCGQCSEIAHSDHSSYVVYQLLGGGGGGWNPGPGNPPNSRREFVQSFHFTDKKTAEAYNKCVRERSGRRECNDSRNYECTPCTVESHTDHSQFDLYRLGR